MLAMQMWFYNKLVCEISLYIFQFFFFTCKFSSYAMSVCPCSMVITQNTLIFIYKLDWSVMVGS